MKSGLSTDIRLTKFLAASLGLTITGIGTQSAIAQNWTAALDQDYNNQLNWQGDAFPEGLNAVINEFSDGFFPILAADPAFTPVDVFVGNGGLEGRLDQRAGNLSTGATNWFFVGVGSGTGTYNLADTSSAGGGISGFGQGTGSLNTAVFWAGGGDYNDNGTGVVNINTSGSITTTGTSNGGGFVLGGGWQGGPADGTVNLENGTIDVANQMWVGRGGNGTFNQSGGTVSSGGSFVIGVEPINPARYTEGTGVYNLTGGVVNAGLNGTTSGGTNLTVIALGRGSTGTLNVSGGTFNTLTGLRVGDGTVGTTGTATGTLNVSGAGVVNVATNTANGVNIAVSANSEGTVNLSGGTLQTAIVKGGLGTSTFNFNGGQLKATANNATFMQGLTAANVQAGGAHIDTNGFDVTIAQALLDGGGNGGLMKLGAGTLTLTGMNTYMGDTAIYDGTLSINTTYLADTANVGLDTILGGSPTFALDFAGTDTINALIINGVPQAAGTWGAPGSGATNESSFFTGTGILNVTSSVPEPGTLMLVLGGGASMLLLARRRNRRG